MKPIAKLKCIMSIYRNTYDYVDFKQFKEDDYDELYIKKGTYLNVFPIEEQDIEDFNLNDNRYLKLVDRRGNIRLIIREDNIDNYIAFDYLGSSFKRIDGELKDLCELRGKK